MAGCQAIAGFPNSTNITGPEFLAFYIPLGIIGIAVAYWLRFSLRSPFDAPDRELDSLSTYEVAFLAGGSDRTIGTAITSLVQQGYVAVEAQRSFLTARKKLVIKKAVDSSCDPVELFVAREISAVDGEISMIFRNSQNIGERIHDRLQQIGLILTDEQSLKVQRYSSLIILVIIAIGVFRIVNGISHGGPVGFLIVISTSVLFVAGFGLAKPYRSRYGDRVLKDLIANSKSLKRINSSDIQLPIAFALFGATVLASDSALADLYQVLTPSSSGGGGGDGGGCGGGGCGGGGCGG
ncbi:TIGR04222 domain-containing membrane protein [Tumidithrix elongata RA019]|uniref:TIGR04222 domain-containing membrane protein n=1 Tax=Tumidithrix elongata BACA0141 TaxID=2716417 RepID=A0AAW9PYT8_9CYAN|nr:TIGR04222 domain-containing membrane protein [Tumidithrix elongata RA019]